MNWRPFVLSDQAWDDSLLNILEANAFQSSSWARHKMDFGWRPVRVLCGPDQAPTAAVQALVKSIAGGRLLWSRGGPVGDPTLWNNDMRDALAQAAGGLAAYGRICSYAENSTIVTSALTTQGWRRPAKPLSLIHI